jgi:hypothetical protein
MVVGSFDGDTWVPWRGGEEEWRPTGLAAAAMMAIWIRCPKKTKLFWFDFHATI